MQWVFDTSITMAWCFEDEKNADSESLLDRITTTPAAVPQIWSLEVGNVLALAMKKGRIKPAQRAQFVELLATFPITIDPETATRALGVTLNLADQHQLTTYDAAYLELAMRLGVPLATLDDELRRAATASGVPLL